MNHPGIKELPAPRISNSSLVAILAVAAGYAATAKLSFLLTISPGNISPIFPAAGVALATVLMLGRNALIGVWLGSFAANALSLFDGTVPPGHSPLSGLLVALIIGLGAMSGAGAGVFLVKRFCKDEHPLRSGRNVLILVTVGVLGGCMVSPTFGVFALALTGNVPWDRFGYSWITWWAGDATGAIVAVPLILAWQQPHPFRRNPWRVVEAAMLGTATILLCSIVFFEKVQFAYGLMPLLLWAAFRFGMRGASTTAAVIAILATIGTTHGGSPFVTDTVNNSLLSLHSFLDVTITCALFLAGILTERKRAAEILQESEIRYRFLFEHNPLPMLIYERATLQVLAVNEAFIRHYGYNREEALGLRLTDLHPDEQKEEVTALIPQLSGHTCTGEWQHRKRDGAFITNVVFSHDLEFQGRNARVAVMTDISERKRVEEQVAEANEELRASNRIASAITGSLNLQEILDFVLHEALDIAGLEGGTICLVQPDETLELAAQVAASEETVRDLTTRQIRVGECLCGKCARTQCPLILRTRAEVLAYSTRESTRGDLIHFHAAFPLIAAGKSVGILCLFTRTDKKPMERRLKLLETMTGQVALAIQNARLYEEIQRHAGELERRVLLRTTELAEARDRAESADRLKSAFLATMSHELRTPLNSIIGFTGILLQKLAGPLNPEQTKQLEMVRNSARHLLALINDVLDISKIEAGQIEIAPAPFDLPEAIEKVLHLVAPLAEKKQLPLVKQIAPGVGQITSDRRRVEQILLNLLSNAIKFTPQGAVTLAACSVDGVIRVSVTDTGIGIKPEDIGKLFQPFRQLDTGLTRQHEGTGLGLAICRRLVERLGGKISVESRWGQGSMFQFTLPVVSERKS